MKRIIYLAAGSSRRFGENKLFFALDGKPLYRHGLDMLAALVKARDDCDLTVVSRYPAVLEAARALGARAADSPESEKGLSYTIRAGMDAAGALEEGDFLVFVVADQPWLTAATVSRLLDAARPGVPAACAVFGERAGNPMAFAAALAPELRALESDHGGREVAARHRPLAVPATSARELDDVDAPEDMER
ncbi:MAG: nucleotidyltransferase family protein [Eubacteriales bacterium]|nr:nucleotidyltransferase family protein [Eubacteriales bacterium]